MFPSFILRASSCIDTTQAEWKCQRKPQCRERRKAQDGEMWREIPDVSGYIIGGGYKTKKVPCLADDRLLPVELACAEVGIVSSYENIQKRKEERYRERIKRSRKGVRNDSKLQYTQVGVRKDAKQSW